MRQLIPSEIKFDPTANPPQFTDNGEQVIEKGTHIRMKLIGTRSDVDKLFAIGSIKEVRIRRRFDLVNIANVSAHSGLFGVCSPHRRLQSTPRVPAY